MAGSQTFLTAVSVALFMYMMVNINEAYINATTESVNHQKDLDALNFGLSLSEQIYAEAYDYDNVYLKYSAYNDVNKEAKRMDQVSSFGDTLSATISFSAEKPILLGENGREVTVTSYYWTNGIVEQVSTHVIPLIPLE